MTHSCVGPLIRPGFSVSMLSPGVHRKWTRGGAARRPWSVGFLLLALFAAAPSAEAFPGWMGNCCSHPNRVTTGTLYAGDLVRFEILMNQDYVGLHAEVGINDGGWSTRSMTYGGNDSGNSWWYYEQRFASGTKNFYFHGWDDWGGNIYDNNGGANYNVTITALNAPSGQSATRDSTNPQSQINLAWTRGTSGTAKDTIILRKTSTITTAPTQGTGYNVNDTIDGATVIYRGSGTSFNDTGLSAGTTYYYAFYAENNSYYSAGVTASASTRPVNSTWDSGGGDNNWKTEANWNNDVYPAASSSTILHFGTGARTSPNNDWAANSAFGQILFDSGSSSFTLGGNAINLASTIQNNSASLQTVNLNLTMTAAASFNASSGNLTVGGTVANGGNRLTSGGANTLTLGGIVSGTGDLLMSGSGSLVLNAANSFNPASGNAAYLVNGTTTANHNTGLGVGAVYVGETSGGNSASLYIGTAGVNVANNLTVRSGSSGTMTLGNSSAGAATFSGGVTLQQNVTLANNSGGTLTLSGSMGFNGGQKWIYVNSGHTALISGAIGNDSAGGLVKKSDGTLQLGGVNTFSGGLYIDRGTVDLTGGSLSASVLHIGTTSAGDTDQSAALKASVAAGQSVSQNITVNTGNGTRTLQTANTSGTASFTGTKTLNKTLTVNVNNGSAAVDAEFITGAIGGAGGLTMATGTGTLKLSGANNFTGAIAINNGVVRASSTTALGTTAGATTVAAGSALELDNVTYANAEPLTLNSDGVASGGALRNVNGSSTFPGPITLNTASRINSDSGTLTLDVASGNAIAGTAVNLTLGGAGNITVADPIATTSGTLTKDGAGTATLSAGSTFTGATTINGGIVSIAADTGLGTAPGSATPGQLAFNGGQLSATAGFTLSANRGIAMTGAGTIDVAASQTLIYSGIIAGSGGALTKAGSGVLTLGGASTFSSGVTLGAGQLNINNAGSGGTSSAIGTGTFTIQGGTIDNTSGGNITLSPTIAQNWNGDFTYAGSVPRDLNLGVGNVALNATRQVTVSAGTLTVGGVISGATYGITKLGNGTLTLSGTSANTYNGTTAVNAGTLTLSKSAGVNAIGGNLTLGGGTVGYGSNNNQIPDTVNVTLNSGTLAFGARTETLGTAATSGAFTMNGGSMTVGSGTVNLYYIPTITAGTVSYTANGNLYAYDELIFNGGTIDLTGSSGATMNLRAGDGTGITYQNSGTSAATITAGNLSLNTAASATTVFTVADAATVGTELSISAAITGAGKNILKGGAGVLQLSGASTFTGTSTLRAGTLVIAADAPSGSAGALGNASSAVVVGDASTGGGDTPALLIGGAYTIGRAITVANQGSTVTLGGNNTSGTATFGGAITLNKNVTLTAASGGLVDIAGGITSNDKDVTVTGAGSSVVRLSSALDGAGAVSVNSGTLRIAGASDRVNTARTLSVAGTFDLNGLNQTAADLTGAGYVDNALAGGSSVLTVNKASGSSTFSGVLQNTGGGSTMALAKSGAGTLTLSGVNTYGGNTTIGAGALALSGSGSIANSPVISIGASATFDVSGRSSALTLASGQGITVTASGSGSPATIATTTGKGLTTAGNSPLVFSSFSSAGGAPLALSGAGTVTLAGGDAVTVTVTGGALGNGTYTLISKGASGGVAGTAPSSLTVNGDGVSGGASSRLEITGGDLILRVSRLPTVVDPTATSITENSATLGANVSNDGGATVTDRGTVYGTSANPTGNALSQGSGTGVFSHDRTGLSPNTYYYYRGYAVNWIGTAYSADGTFWTLANVPSAPTVATVSTNSISVDVNPNSNPSTTEFAIYETSQGKYVQANGTLGASAVWATDSAWGVVGVTNLDINQQYTFEVKARNGGGTETAYSGTVSAYTLAAVPATPAVAAVSSTSLSVDVNVNGNPSATEFAIYETTQGKYVQSDGTLGASAVWATDASWGVKNVTGLNVNQQYTFQVKARNGSGTETAYSATASKYTLAAVPSAPTVNNPTATTLDVTVNANGNPSSTALAIREAGGQYVQSDGTLGASAVWQTASAWGTRTVIGLASSTTYTFDVKARNGDSVETAFGSTAANTTLSSAVSLWTGGGADAKWSTGNNWSDLAEPASTTNATFYGAIASGTNINIDAAKTILGLRFNNAADTALNFTNSQITINANGVAIDVGADGTHVLAMPIVLGADQAWTNDSIAALTVKGVVSGGGALTKYGAGRIILTSNNTFTAALTIHDGPLQIQHNGALGDAGNGTVVSSGGALEVQGSLSAVAEPLTLNGTGVSGGGALRNTVNANTISGALALGSDAKIQVDANSLNLGGGITAGANTLYVQVDGTALDMTGGSISGSKTTGDGAIRKSGAGRLTLRPDAALTGSIYLDGDSLYQGTGNSSTLPAGGTLYMADGTTYRSDGNTARTVAKNIQINGNVTIGHTGGSGALTLSGNVDLNAATRTITVPNDNTISGQISNGGLTKGGAGILTLSGNNSYSSDTTISAGTLQIGAGATSGSVAGNIVDNAALIFNRSDDTTFGYAISGSGTVEKKGAGARTLSGNNSYDGLTTVSGGMLKLGHANALGTTAAGTTVGSGYTLDLNGQTIGAEAVSIVGTGIGSAGALVNNNGAASLSGNITLAGAATIGGSGDSTLSGTISGTSALTKQGAGAITLSGNNAATLTGAGSTITIGAGTLKLGHVGALGDTAAATTANGGTLDLNGLAVGAEPVTLNGAGVGSAGALVNNNGTASLSGNITLSGAATIGGSGASTLSGTISGTSALTKQGAGTITLSGNNAATLTGAGSTITVSGGTLKLGHAGALGDTTGGTTVGSGFTLDLNGQTVGAEPVTLSGDGIGSLGALINSSASAASLSGNITMGANITLGVSAGDMTLGGTINESSGAMNMTKIGSGTLTLSGANLVDGVFYVNAGTVKLGNGSALNSVGAGKQTEVASGAMVDLNGQTVGGEYITINGTGIGSAGALVNNSGSAASLSGPVTLGSASSVGGSGDISFGGAFSGAATLTKVGAGTHTLTADSSAGFTGKLSINAGTLAFQTSGLRLGAVPGSYVADQLTLNGGTLYLTGASDVTIAANRGFTLGASGGALSADAARKLTVSPIVTGSGNLTKAGAGTVALSGANDYTGKTILNAGTLQMDDEQRLGANPGGSTADQLTFNGGTLQATGSFTIDDSNRGITIGASGGTLDVQANTVTFATAMAGSGALAKSGTGTLVLSAAGSYSGTMTISAGAAHANANVGSMVVTVNAGTKLRGSGTVASANVAGSIEPGSDDNTIGTLTMNATGTGLTMPAGGTYRWEVSDVNGAAGTGYDQIKVGGSGNQTVNITASSGSRFNIEVDSNSGTPANWNANSWFSWTIADAGTLSGFDTNVFTIGTSSFSPSFTAGFFSLENVSGDLMLYYIGEPGTSASAVNFTSVGDTTMTVNWTRGSGRRCLVVMRDGGAVNTDPLDGDVYTASATFGSGSQLGTGNYVVYDGSDTPSGSVAVSGLTAGHTYYVAVYEYNFGGTTPTAGRTNYRQTNPATGNSTTYATEPAANPNAPTFSQVAGTSLKITWTGGSAAGTIVVMKEGSAVNADPSDGATYTASSTFGSGSAIGTGNYVVYVSGDGGAGNVTVTGLKEGTTYYVALYCYNGSGSLVNYKTPTTSTGNKTTLGEPYPVAANVNGKEMVNLTWTRNDSHNTLILAKTSAITTPPTQGTGYSIGNTIDGATVIYTGSGSALDHVVQPNTTCYYTFFTRGASEDYYSTGTAVSVSMSSYDSGEIVDQIAYTNSTMLNTIGNGGGNYWNGNWTDDTASYYVQGGSFSTQPNYPPTAANKLKVSPGSGEAKKITRSVTNWFTHVVYASFIVNFQYGGNTKWSGAYLMDNTSQRVFFGECGGGDQKLGVVSSVSTKTLTAGAGNDYIIMVKYDIDNDNAYAVAYKVGTDTVPATEPGTWDTEYLNVNPSGGGYWINGIRLESGGSAGVTPGDTYFDEVRMASSWGELVRTDSTAPVLPGSGTVDGEYFRAFAGTTAITPESGSGTTNVWYRIPDNLFGAAAGAGRSGNLQNPGFDGSDSGWTRTSGNNVANYSSSAGTLAGGSGGGLQFNAWDNSLGAFGKYYQDVAVTAGAQCAFSALMREDVDFSTTFFGVKIQFVDVNDNVLAFGGANENGDTMKSTVPLDTTTQRISVAATAPSGSDRVRCMIVMTDPPGPGGGGGIPSDLSNKGFDGSASSWTKQSDSGSIAFYDGNAGANAGGTGGGLKFDAYNSNGSGGYYQDAACQVGDNVTFSARMKQNGTWTTTFFGTRIQFLSAADAVLATYSSSAVTAPVTTQSKIIPVSGTAPAGTAKVRCIIRMEGSPGGSDLFGYADDVTLSGATTAGSGSSRFGYVDSCQLSGAGASGTASNSLMLVFCGYDPDSGLSRDTTDPNSHCNLDVTNYYRAWKVDDVAGYSAARSSSDARFSNSTSTWYWASLINSDFSPLETDNYDNTNKGSAYAADGRVFATNRVTLTVANGSASIGKLINQQYGYLSIKDDDIDAPVPTLLYVGTNILNDWGTFSETNRKITITDQEMLGGDVDLAYQWYDASGIFLTNAAKGSNGKVITNVFEMITVSSTNYDANVCPNFDLTNATYGSLGYDAIHSPEDLFGNNGDQFVTARVVNVVIPGISKTKIPLEEPWTLTVSAQDLDDDRGSFILTYTNKSDAYVTRDRTVAINVPLEFHIVDDDVDGPTFDPSQTLTEFGATISDGQLRQGGWALKVGARDVGSGLSRGDGTATSPTNISPFVSIYSPSNYPLVVNDVFSNYLSIVDGVSGKAAQFDLTNVVAAADYNNLVLGIYTVTVSIADGDDDRFDTNGANIDRALTLNTNVGTFTVYDDDTDPPVFTSPVVDGPGASKLSTAGELLFYDFGTTTAETNLQPTRAVDAISVSNLLANGVWPDMAPGLLGGAAVRQNNWTGTTNFWEFAVTVQENFRLNVTNLSFASRATATGPTSWTLRYSADSYASVRASGSLVNDGTTQIVSSAVSSGMVVGAVTYRLYGAGASSGGGTWTLDSMTFSGRVATVASAFLATDSDLNTNGVKVAVAVQDAASGVRSISDSLGPRYAFISPSGVVGSAHAFGLGPTINGDAKGAPVTMADTGGFAYADIVLGTYTVTVREVDADDDRVGDSLTNVTEYQLLVVDDDTVAPKISSQRGTYLTFNGISAGSAANGVTDGSLTNGLSITDKLYDAKSGILSASVQFRVQDPAGWDSGLRDFTTRPADGAALASTYSTGGTMAVTGYNVDLVNRSLGVWTAVLYAADFDNDRPGDAATNAQSFQMYVIDDDTLGPRMTNFTTLGTTGVLIANGFETNDGWSGHNEGDWTSAAYDGTWVSTGMYVNSLNGRGTQGFNAGFNDVGDTLEMPPVDRPGWVVLWAAASGSGGPEMALDRLDGGVWTNIGTNVVSPTAYAEFSWTVASTNLGERLRLRMASRRTSGSTDRSIYVDDIVVAAYKDWTNGGALNLAWSAANDKFTGDSGISQYRYMGFGAGAPLVMTDGVQVTSGLSTSLPATAEGVVTGYVFAVDADEDRGAIDRAMGMPLPYVLRVDATPPPRVAGMQGTNGFDETSEAELQWTPAPNAGNRQSDNTPLSPWYSYEIYYEQCDACNVTTNSHRLSFTNGLTTLNTNTTAIAVVSNLEFDANYRFVIAGRDRAGNLGQLSDTADVTTINFVVTQGLAKVAGMATGEVEVSWMAAEERSYDMLYADGWTFRDNMTNSWRLLQTVTNSWFYDMGGTNIYGEVRARPSTLWTNMRYYRVSRQGTWQTNVSPRRGSREVYVTKCTWLRRGENWVSMYFNPDTQTVAYVLGTNRLPSGDQIASATKVSWYGATSGGSNNFSGAATSVIWLANSGNWIYDIGGSGSANGKLMPLNQGFTIELPVDQSAQALVMIGRLPTTEVVQAIGGGSTASNVYNVLSYNVPVHMALTGMGFRGSGFIGNNNGAFADEIRILRSSGNGSLEQPKARLRLRSDGTTWQYYSYSTNDFPNGAPSPDQYVIEPDEAIVIIRRNAGTMYWTNKISYTPPGKNFNP